MTDGRRIVTIPRHDPVDALTMGGTRHRRFQHDAGNRQVGREKGFDSTAPRFGGRRSLAPLRGWLASDRVPALTRWAIVWRPCGAGRILRARYFGCGMMSRMMQVSSMMLKWKHQSRLTRACQMSLASSYFLACRDGWWRLCSRNPACLLGSGSLLQLPFHGGDHFIGGVEGAECAAFVEILRRLGQAGVDDSALGGSVFNIGRGQLCSATTSGGRGGEGGRT